MLNSLEQQNVPIARRENGDTDMYLSTAVKLAEFYDVSMDIFSSKEIKK
ncbi:TPA: hypothetical protein ACGO26_001290 [Streptococcus suis]